MEPHAEPLPERHAQAEKGALNESSPTDKTVAAQPDHSRVRIDPIALLLALYAAGAILNVVWLVLGAVRATGLCRAADASPTQLLTELEMLVRHNVLQSIRRQRGRRMAGGYMAASRCRRIDWALN